MIDESALAALTLYRSFVGETPTPDAETFLHALLQCAGPRFIATTGRLDDVRYCATPNQSAVVPRVQPTPDGPTVISGQSSPAAAPAGAIPSTA
jgi:hypothetical protein